MNNIFMRLLKVLIAGILPLMATFLGAQEGGHCLHFDDLPAGAVYGDRTGYVPGDLLPGPADAPPIRLRPFHYLNGTSDFLQVFVYDKSILNWDIGAGNIIFPSNINLDIDFSVLPYPVTEVCLEFFDGGGEENIAVNGQPVRILRDFFELLSTDAETEIAPGVTLTIERNPTVDLPAGRLCLHGTIQTLLIGGQELGIDNICYRSEADTECRIDQVGIDLEPCTPNGIAYGTLKFEASGAGSEGYTVRGNGREYGRFRYDDPFPRLGPFSADGQTVYELVVIDNENPDCRNYVAFGPLSCESKCSVAENLQTRIINCHDDGSYDLLVDLDLLTNTTKTPFELMVEGHSIGTFMAEVLPLILFHVQIPTDALQFTVEACFETDLTDANGNPIKCCLTDTVEKQCPPACTPGEIEVTNIECATNATFNATLNFRHNQSADDYFIIRTGSGFTGRFQYRELPKRLTGLPLPGADDNGNFQEIFLVCQADDTSDQCCSRVQIELPCPLADCELGELFIRPTPCDGNGQFSVYINFEHRGGSGAYILSMNGNEVAEFGAGDLPFLLTEPAFFSPFTEPVQFIVRDREFENCTAEGKLQPFDCEPVCQLGALQVTGIECLNDGTYNATINFRQESAGEGFILHTAGGFRGVFRYADLPVRLRGLPQPADRNGDVFEICDQQQENCCARAEVELPCRDNCRLGELQLSPLRCTDDGQYFVKLDLEHEAPGLTFTLFLNEKLYGNFEYAALPLTIGPFPGNAQPLTFQLTDDTYSCQSRGAIEGQRCSEQPCSFANLNVQPSECDNGVFLINLAFTPQNTGERGYYVFVDGDIFGPFPYTDNQIRLGPFPADGSMIYDILLLDAINPECYAYAEVGPINCREECLISDFKVELGSCNPDGTYRVQVDFNAQNAGNEFFDLYLQEQFIGYYPLSDLPLTINLDIPPDDNAHPDDDPLAVFRVCINDRPECCARTEAERGACDTAEDEISDVWPGDANTDRIANHLDLLNLGLAFGSQGPDRQEQSTDWEGLVATNWPQYFADGTNFKHADANGDGTISAADIEVILLNYGRTNGTPVDFEPLPATELDPPVFIEWPDLSSLPPGTEVEIPIFLGSEARPLKNIYGAAFSLEFDPDLFTPGSTSIHFHTSWFGQPGVNVLTISHLIEENGLAEIALSRSDQNEVSGYGPVAYFKGIIDDIAGIRRDWEFSLARAMSIDKGQHILPLVGLSTTVELPPAPSGKVTRENLRRHLRFFPNPTDATVNIQNAFRLPLEWVEILDSTGRLVSGRQFNTNVVTLSTLPAGVFVLRLKIGPYILHERIIKQ